MNTNKVLDDTMDTLQMNINELPDEILLEIFSYIAVEEIALNIQFVCNRWAEICLIDTLWKDSHFSVRGNASDNYVTTVLQNASKLSHFSIWFRVPLRVIKTLSETCRNLCKLDICVPEVECALDIFNDLVRNCSKIEILTIPGNVLAKVELSELVAQWQYLNTLHLIGRSDKPIVLKPLGDGSPSLEHFHMSFMKCSNDDLEYFLSKKKDQLLSLSISPNVYEGPCVIPLLVACNLKLKTLYLEDSRFVVNLNDFSAIKSFTNLEDLSIRIPRGVNTEVVSNIFESNAMSQLLKLSLNNYADLNDSLVHTICNNCPHLRKLSLRYSTHLMDDGLKYICKCQQLEYLDLYYCIELTDIAVDYILQCKKLKYLNLGFCKLTERSMVRMTEFSKLTELALEACDVSGLCLDIFPLCLRYLRRLRLDYCRNVDHDAISVLQAEVPSILVTAKRLEPCP